MAVRDISDGSGGGLLELPPDLLAHLGLAVGDALKPKIEDGVANLAAIARKAKKARQEKKDRHQYQWQIWPEGTLLMDNRYLGWMRFWQQMQEQSASCNVVAHGKAKNGYLAIELPWSAPMALRELADEIERLSDITCQHCGAAGATEVLDPRQRWVLKLCNRCQIANTHEMDQIERQRAEKFASLHNGVNPRRGNTPVVVSATVHDLALSTITPGQVLLSENKR